MMGAFKAVAPYQPAGDQTKAIAELTEGIQKGYRKQILKGVTGSGKTFTMAKIIEKVGKPTLVLSHNKTLAAQLYREFKDFFPDNAVEYFVSYYDYYQPEAYVPSKDLYIEKDASINDEIERLRLAATSALLERSDVIIVSTVSCIYGLGDPTTYSEMRLVLKVGEQRNISLMARQLVDMQYERNDAVGERGNFRIHGDSIEIFPAYSKMAYRIEFDWDEISSITEFDPITRADTGDYEFITVYPAKHFVVPPEELKSAMDSIRDEMEERYAELMAANKVLEAQRIKSRTEYDIEMMEEMGYCSGIENYSRHLTGRREGERPFCLIDYFPKNDFLLFVDESHVTLSQVRAMYEGDHSRKQTLYDHGFRLKSAMDNRPLKYPEFEALQDRVIYVSATPGPEEYEKAENVVEQIIRPTGLLDPEIVVRPTKNQIEDLYKEIKERIKGGDRVLITTLTKKMAEDLTDYLSSLELKVRYMHSEIETFERVEIIKELRTGKCDVLVGINLLREGLDIPEVSLIAIMDADKIGFLRSATSLIQTIGRAARNVNGKVIMYADKTTDAMAEAIAETQRRRAIQQAYNTEHGITPTTIKKSVQDILVRVQEEKRKAQEVNVQVMRDSFNIVEPKNRKKLIKALEKEMLEHAKNLEFEEAAVLRDEIERLKEIG
ncbi:MAG: excinuclease ABC subunit B [Spirochaetia bacterium]|nr:excinuclease ABC subunit B [Spirochaetia bacterium]